MRHKNEDVNRILVVMPTWVGDVVMATPALGMLRRRFTHAEITLLIRPNTHDVIVPGPWMDSVIEWNPAHGISQLKDTMLVAARLRRQRFDWAILLSNAFRMALVVWLAGIPRRTGYRRDGRTLLLTDRLLPQKEGGSFKLMSTVHYYNDLMLHAGCEGASETMELHTSTEAEDSVSRRLRNWGIQNSKPLIVVNPGASFGISKLWMPERYAAVADLLVENRDATVVITCGPGEEDLAWKIHKQMRHASFVVDRPRGSLAELKAIIRRCDLLLNNDTGPRHIAKAFGRPVVTVFGSTHTGWTHTDYPLEREVKVPVDCGPCQQKRCPESHHKCMTGVTVEMVYQSAIELLDSWYGEERGDDS